MQSSKTERVSQAVSLDNPLLDAALTYAARGWRVLPLRPDAEFLPNPVDTALFAPKTAPSAHQSAWVACALTEVKGAGRILRACRLLAETQQDRLAAAAGEAPAAASRSAQRATALLSGWCFQPAQEREHGEWVVLESA